MVWCLSCWLFARDQLLGEGGREGGSEGGREGGGKGRREGGGGSDGGGEEKRREGGKIGSDTLFSRHYKLTL